MNNSWANNLDFEAFNNLISDPPQALPVAYGYGNLVAPQMPPQNPMGGGFQMYQGSYYPLGTTQTAPSGQWSNVVAAPQMRPYNPMYNNGNFVHGYYPHAGVPQAPLRYASGSQRHGYTGLVTPPTTPGELIDLTTSPASPAKARPAAEVIDLTLSPVNARPTPDTTGLTPAPP